MDLQHYPFDNQNCVIHIANKGNEGEYVELIPENLTYSGSIDVFDYIIESTRIYSEENIIKIKVTFSRRVMNAVLSTFLPGIFMCFVRIYFNITVAYDIQ